MSRTTKTLARTSAADRVPVHAETVEFITVQQFAEEMGIPVQTVYRWRTEGKGPRAHKIGRHVRFSRHSVNEWLEQQLDPRPAA